jgi:beta-N-acetylhexosaminidase
MDAVASESPELAGGPKRRADAALARIRHVPEPLNVVDARQRFTAALAALA